MNWMFIWDDSKVEDTVKILWEDFGASFLDERTASDFYEIIDAAIYSAIFETNITQYTIIDHPPLTDILKCISEEQLKEMRKQVLTKYKRVLIEMINNMEV